MSDNCGELLLKAVKCILTIIMDNLSIALILFLILFMIIALYRSTVGEMLGEKIGLMRGTGTRNQIEMFNKRVKKYQNI